jgi:hypothetical protein
VLNIAGDSMQDLQENNMTSLLFLPKKITKDGLGQRAFGPAH